MNSGMIQILGAVEPTPNPATSSELSPKERALLAGKKISEWVKQGIRDAKAGKFDPNKKDGGSERYADFLAGGDFLIGRLSQAYKDSGADAGVGKLVTAAVEIQTEARNKTVQYATDVSALNLAVLHLDEGVQLLGAALGEALGWTADRIVKPLAIGAGIVGGLYVVVRWGIPAMFAEKPKR